MRETGRGPEQRGSRGVLALLVLACLTVITLDARGGTSSPVEPLRAVVGSVVGPAESATAAAVRPFQQLGGFFDDNRGLRREVATLSAQNSQLRSRLATSPLDERRLRELDALTSAAHRTGYTLVAAHVVGMGPMQSFSRTVTLDAGTSSGIRADMTVLNGDGLVGRVVRATTSTATVLLVVDQESVVGGRLGSNLEIGFVKGRGGIGGNARLDLDLVDTAVTPARGDVLVTWGSPNGVPYVAGIPIGRVQSVYSTPRELATHAVVQPYVDFTALDVVGVVVPRHTRSDHTLINGAGSTR